ncbi:BgTH12-04132, partial [Blumeria graminis f. sp. triticale]
VCSLISLFVWFDFSSHKDIVHLVVIQIFSENRLDEEAVITTDQAGKPL